MIASALQGYEVSNIAKSITVSIEGTSTDPIRSGSGVVVSKEDRDGEHLYQVLTNWHVVDHEGEYWIKTLDAELHPVDYNQVKRVPNTDIAILQFRSQHIYSVAQIGDASQLIEGMTVFFAGYPTELLVRFDAYPERSSVTDIAGEERNYKFVTANVTMLLNNPRYGGYSIGYDEGSSPGMSGGPVLNENGELIAIHGMAEVHHVAGSVGNYGISSLTFQNWQERAIAVIPPDKNMDSHELEMKLSGTISPERQMLSLEDLFLAEDSLSSRDPINYVWPTSGTLTSGFGWRYGRIHKGVDIVGPVGTPIIAMADGIVINSGWNSAGYGNLLQIEHMDGSTTLYAHNSRLLVHEGQSVKQGQLVAEMGATGYSNGPHLHFEIHLPNQGAVNPMAYLPR